MIVTDRGKPSLVLLSFVSESRKIGDGVADPNVVAWFAEADLSSFYISPITLWEIEVGILRAERRNVAGATRLRQWMSDSILLQFADRTLSISAAVALRCARLHVPNSRPDNDAWIAATALVHNMAVVTRNVADFASTGVRLINPWVQQSRKPGPLARTGFR